MLAPRNPLISARLLVSSVLLFVLSGCAQSRECPWVAADQKSSFMAAPEEFPVTLLIDLRWNENEKQAIQAAARSWNDFASRSGKKPFFELRDAAVTDLSQVKNIEACQLTQGSQSEFVVAKFTANEAWEAMGFSSSTPGVTLRCTSGDQVKKQAVLIHSGLITPEQLQSVFVHEMGHVLGLDHSCQLGSGTQSFISCSGLEAEHPYREAIMYPALRIAQPLQSQKSSGTGLGTYRYDPSTLQIKEMLQQNDSERASCLLAQ